MSVGFFSFINYLLYYEKYSTISLRIRGGNIMRLNRKGQTLVEYVLIISLITVLAIGLVKVFGGYLQDAVTKMGWSISGKEYVEGEKVGGGYCSGDEDKLFE